MKKEVSILIVEDDKMSRDLCAQMLQEEYSMTYTAASITEAKLQYNLNTPDIILLDLTLPDGNGLDFLRTLRKEDLRTKVIVLTAHSDVETILAATDLKLTKYLIKPLKLEELNKALNEAIEELRNFHVEKSDSLKLPYGYIWDRKTKTLYKESKPVQLTNKQTALFELLSKSPNSPIPKEHIIHSLWEENSFESAATNLKTLVKNLRKKVPEELIVSVYGVGYKLKTTL